VQLCTCLDPIPILFDVKTLNLCRFVEPYPNASLHEKCILNYAAIAFFSQRFRNTRNHNMNDNDVL
jgi:hypothetical protein